MIFPKIISNWIEGKENYSFSQETFDKKNPHNGETICQVTRSKETDIDKAVTAAQNAQESWNMIPPVQRGKIIRAISQNIETHKIELAEIISIETGKSKKDALGEIEGAILLAEFYAGEGQRMYGKTTTSGVQNKYALIIRKAVGVAGLIIAANTPIANIAWKVFPAIICGNSVVLKAAEDTPVTAWFFGKIAHMSGLPPGVLNIIQGFGEEAGEPLVKDERVKVLSFTGSTEVGRRIAKIAGGRLAKISLELGGKNALVVCDDADLESAVRWSVLSSFSNAGQRCASASRIVVFESIFDDFLERFNAATNNLKLGPHDTDDLGPVINERQLNKMITSINCAKGTGGIVLTGGIRSPSPDLQNGYYLLPTILMNINPDDEIAQNELFGPITIIFKVRDFTEAVNLVNNSQYGLTASIHTKNLDRAAEFIRQIKTGVCVINGGTYGSEPHMPFGGVKMSGNGTREPGTEALDIYSDLMDVYINITPNNV